MASDDYFLVTDLNVLPFLSALVWFSFILSSLVFFPSSTADNGVMMRFCSLVRVRIKVRINETSLSRVPSLSLKKSFQYYFHVVF